jgi:hypothetical protein
MMEYRKLIKLEVEIIILRKNQEVAKEVKEAARMLS